ncbi:MAG: hypothetical protein J4F42_20265 [Desulfurellaceae bacterium]|nr:hypothetical protein [Desulfurellaceae bacterium]
MQLVERLSSGQSDEVIAVLASAPVATTAEAMGECFSKADPLGAALEETGWELFEAIRKLTDERQQEAEKICDTIVQALQSDEHVIPLALAFQAARSQAITLLTESHSGDAAPTENAVVKGKRIVNQRGRDNLDISTARDLLVRLEQELRSGQTIRLNMRWVIEEGESEQ